MPRAPPNHGTPVADYFSCASCNGGLENERAKVVEKMALIKKFLLVYILQVGFCLFPDGWDPVVAVNCALILASHPFFANFCGSQPGVARLFALKSDNLQRRADGTNDSSTKPLDPSVLRSKHLFYEKKEML